MEREQVIAVTVISVAALACLTIIVIAYWLIMKQDATILASTSAAIGGLVGYLLRYITGKRK